MDVGEIEEAIKSVSPQKSQGPEGFNADLFKISWPIIGSDVSKAVLDFFRSGKLLN